MVLNEAEELLVVVDENDNLIGAEHWEFVAPERLEIEIREDRRQVTPVLARDLALYLAQEDADRGRTTR